MTKKDFLFSLIENADTERLQTLQDAFAAAQTAEKEKRAELSESLARLNKIAVQLLDASGPAEKALLLERQEVTARLSMLPTQIGETTRRRALAHLQTLKALEACLLSEFEAIKESLRPLLEIQEQHRVDMGKLEQAAKRREITTDQLGQQSQAIWYKMHDVEAQMKPLRIRLEKLQTAKDVPNNRAAAYSTTLHHPDHVWKQAAKRAGQEAKKMAMRELQQTTPELALV